MGQKIAMVVAVFMLIIMLSGFIMLYSMLADEQAIRQEILANLKECDCSASDLCDYIKNSPQYAGFFCRYNNMLS